MTVFVRLMAFVIGIAIGVAAFSIPYLNRITAVENRAEVKINGQIFVADVVRDPKDQAQGLAGRDRLSASEGMLFLFSEEGRYGFWMKGMKIPIDIIWIRNNAIVGMNEYVFPEPDVPESKLTVYYPPEAVDSVLEVAAGRVQSLRAEVGDPVKMRPLIKFSGLFKDAYGSRSN